MTVSIQTTKQTYDGNDATTQFAIPFPFQDNTDITVIHIDSEDYETTLVLDTNYSISGSTLTYPISGTPLPSGEKLVIYRNTPITQPYNLGNQGAFFLGMLESACDRVVQQIQQIKEMIDRCPKLAITDTNSPPSITEFNSALSTVQALQTAFDNLVVQKHTETATSDQTVFTMPAAWPDLDASSNVSVYDNGLKIDRDDYSVTDTDEITFTVGRTVDHVIIFELNEALSSDALDAVFASYKNHQHWNGVDNGGCRVARGKDYTLAKDAYGYGKVVGFEGMATGSTVDAGVLTQKTNSSLTNNGFSVHFSGVTLTGSGEIYLRYRMSSEDAKQFKNRYASFSCKVLNDILYALNYRIYVRKADAQDDFSSVTEIGNSGDLTVEGSAVTSLKYENINMGSCGNGIEIEIKITCGAVTTRSFEFAELQFEVNEAATEFRLLPVQLLKTASCFLVTRDTQQVIPSGGTGYGFSLDVIVHDPLNEYDVSTCQYKPLRKGYYFLFALGGFNNGAGMADGDRCKLSILKGATCISQRGETAAKANDWLEPLTVGIAYNDGDDIFTVNIYHDHGSDRSTSTGDGTPLFGGVYLPNIFTALS